MVDFLARADVPVSSDWKLALVMTYLGIIAGAALLAFIPVRLAGGRGNRRPDLLLAAAVVWGVASAAIFLPATADQMKWSTEQTTLIESGYYDPQDTSAAPHWPWLATSIIAFTYMALVVWALAPMPRQPIG